ncbi:MAG TPA: type II toxin-antitoxin system prevent-host-death family antitoxin, partial [Steroidobacteraceae bacterium]
RELKDRLSEYLREVRRGESVLVTDRGEVVAEFSPPRQSAIDSRIPAALAALAKRGLVTLGSGGENIPYNAMPRSRRGRHSAAKLLDEERGPR